MINRFFNSHFYKFHVHQLRALIVLLGATLTVYGPERLSTWPVRTWLIATFLAVALLMRGGEFNDSQPNVNKNEGSGN